MNMYVLIKHGLDISVKHPELRQKIQDIIQLCQDEIDQDGTTTDKIKSAIQDIDNLLE